MRSKNIFLALLLITFIGFNFSCGGSDGDDNDEQNDNVASNICNGVDITTGFWNNGNGDRLFIATDSIWIFRVSGVDITSGTWSSACPDNFSIRFDGTVLDDVGNSAVGDPVSCTGFVTAGDPTDPNNLLDILSLTCSEGHIDPDFMPNSWFHEN